MAAPIQQQELPTRHRALSHQEYLETLQTPTPTHMQEITEVQLRKEREIDQKYHHPPEVHEAARTIQRAYRGHRARRQLDGLTLDPSERWAETFRELRWRRVITPHSGSLDGPESSRPRAASDAAKLHWQRVRSIAEHASFGQSPTREQAPDPASATSSSSRRKSTRARDDSLLLDRRYFLEMVDEKHRYGANLQVFHEEWQRSKTDLNFFDWLDRGPGRKLDLPGCSRAKLDKECIRYLSREERKNYLVEVDAQGKLRWARNGELITTSVELYHDSAEGIVPVEADPGSSDAMAPSHDKEEQTDTDTDAHPDVVAAGHDYFNNIAAKPHDASPTLLPNIHKDNIAPLEPLPDASPQPQPTLSSDLTPAPEPHHSRRHFVSPATILNHLLRAAVKPGTWIYVADTAGHLYVGIKCSGAFQHASFLSGARISSAGALSIHEGQLTYLSPLSGHYRPTTASFRRFIAHLHDAGVDLSQMKTSKAYAVLLGMEAYGRTTKGVKRLFHGHGRHE